MEKMNSESLDLTKLNIEKLKELFPNVVTEEKIDFDVLRTVLGDEVDDNKEKYQFTWKGKNNAIKLAQTPSSATLRPDKDSSKDWDTTENLYIEGDNLEVLKQLQKTYYGKIKMIYIDPPYNTGNDFVYHDDFKNSLENYKEQTNQSMKSNPETNGRYHTDWLNMMYPRLSLSKNLLSDNGIICIQIDDNEYCNLKKMCDDIFGESNFMTTIVVKMSEPTGVKMAHVNSRLPKLKEYILVYKKNPEIIINSVSIPKEKWDFEYKLFVDGLTKKELETIKKIRDNEDRTQEDVEIVDFLLSKITLIPLGAKYRELNITSLEEQLIFNKENSYRIIRTVSMSGGAKKIADKKRTQTDKIFYSITTPQKKMYIIKGDYDSTMEQPRIKVLFANDYLTVNPCDLWTDIKTTGLDKEGGVEFRNGKKPLKLIERLIDIFTDEDDIVLDYFSGSGTTGQACIEINKINNSNRKFILIQLPEKISEKNTICDIALERFNNIYIENKKTEGLFTTKIDVGLKYFFLDSTNIQPWDNETELTEDTLFNLSDVFKEDRSKEDILYEIMLKYGVFDMPASEVKVNGKTMYRVGKRYMIVCLEDEITSDDVKAIAELSPRTVVFKESGFKNDNDKINAEYNLEKAGVEDIKCI